MKPKVRARAISRRNVSGRQSSAKRLASDQRMVEFDLGLDAEAARIGPKFAVGIAGRDPHRLEHADVAARLVERLDADLIDRRNERRRAAVHDRDFRPVDLDHRIVHAEPAQRRQHMLGRRHQRARRIAQNGGEFGGGDGAEIGADFALAAAVKTGADEPAIRYRHRPDAASA